MRHRFSRPHFWLATVLAFSAGLAMAAEPVPFFDLDFTAPTGGPLTGALGRDALVASGASVVRYPGGRGVELGPRVRVRDGAAVFDGSDKSFLKLADEGAFRKASKEASQRLLGVSARLRFDGAPKKGEPFASFGFFQLRRTPEGLLEVRLLPGPTEIMASPLLLVSRGPVKAGVWHDLAISFSAERRRYSFYLDGHWQMDNAIPEVPETLRRDPPDLRGFRGAVAWLTAYDAALASDELTPAAVRDETFAARLDALRQRTRNPALRRWADDLEKRERDAWGRPARPPSAATAGRIARDLANAESLAAFATNNVPFVTYDVPATSQEMFLPYRLPEDGKPVRSLRVFAARGEYRNASVLVVPLRPAKAFTLRFTDLAGPGGAKLPASAFDVRLVKRWFRAGGAWMSYHADKRSRVLTPDLLLFDERTVRVDEIRETNELRLQLPEGETYYDISRAFYDRPSFNLNTIPFRDADTLQPVALPEAGRNQQYVYCVHVPTNAVPGLYRGRLQLVADGAVADSLPFALDVLPFDLPPARTYYDLDRTYFGHVNYNYAGDMGRNPESFRAALKTLLKYNLWHLNLRPDVEWRVQICREMGYPLDEFPGIGLPVAGNWLDRWGGPRNLLREPEAKILDRLFLRGFERYRLRLDALLGTNAVFYPVFTGEADHYGIVRERVNRAADLYRANTRVRRFAHSMTERYLLAAVDSTEMDSCAQIRPEWAAIWHAAGGRVMNYAEPFPGAENPAWFRRKIGLEMYKAKYDGTMLHGFVTTDWGEFNDWPEDNAYKNFGMAYAQHNGLIEKLALVGAGEAFNDVRYATALRRQALPLLASSDLELLHEAKRQLAWLESVDGKTYDMDAFRRGCALRIVTLRDLIRIREGR